MAPDVAAPDEADEPDPSVDAAAPPAPELLHGVPVSRSRGQLVLHPGRDGEFGNDDDLSNFWPGTRKDYLDSLNQ